MSLVQLWVESPRGHDHFGTTPTGEVVSDFVANQNGIPFQEGVPQDKIEEAVKTQLKDEKWVTLAKEDGSSEILTKSDIPIDQKPIDDLKDIDIETQEDDDNEEYDTDEPKTPTPVVNPFGVDTKGTPSKTSSTLKSKGVKVDWANKFQRVTSATATKKAGGG